ncbi:ABC transporter ATP-binding protein/permease [Mesorhizobium sp. RP14(2022)]|uniref:ABC transporter ATP-binding protein/permease n=1 Tax=Mesorhizobium liriopis TaxID=2953882 RepID=A0ABT1C2D8_9HYPH|nr:ABC transporter ATP-binding protein/permease [Mesorhizobium liriopis]MCO6048937.1 ABC transporter ATP-binding protein/permease [Mesorhizobium liriopis]
MNMKPVVPPASKEQTFGGQLRMMRAAFMASPARNAIFLLCAGLLGIILATAYGQVLLNSWNKPFYDAIERRNLAGFFQQLLVFVQIAAFLLVLNTVQAWFNQMLHIKLREGLTHDLLKEWMAPGRGARLAAAGAVSVNPDQRVHQDAMQLADLSADLGIGLMQSGILLVSFIGVLWSISAGFSFMFNGTAIAIPGYMVWAAFLYAGVASALSWLVGRPLIKLNSERYEREAAMRFALVRVNENREAIALEGAEAGEERRLEENLSSVLKAVRNIMNAVVRLTFVTSGYGWITVVAPIVIASPVYFSGHLSFGGLMMAAAAFTQVHTALRWFVDHIGAIADWRATLLRVGNFRAALTELPSPIIHPTLGIRLDASEENRVVFDKVAIISPVGRARLSEPQLVVAPGERIAITGEAGVGKTLLFKAMAGLWREGEGRIGLPKGASVAFVPAAPYMPPGTLREALSYPMAASDVAANAAPDLLDRLGLRHLSDRLDRVGRWDRELSEDDQRLVAFARLAMHRPDWIVVNQALDSFHGPARERVFKLFETELKDSALLNIGQVEKADGTFFSRVVELKREPMRGKAKVAERV